MEAEMADRIVDVYLKGKRIESYPVRWAVMNTAPVRDQDFIDLAKDAMREDKYSSDEIRTASFEIRMS
jgi:hypothetical protein